ncbi:HAD family hydrolase [Desulfonatronum thioautotrophicum]|uniref:HAD family hydrolase n=1 Tax=Desulfonatronum thioautotrophicum TaxID=617001 RepID=UPI0005EB6917|nr:HAD family phosphatase [Desulfonatronum thioautotrophicum]
MSDAPCTVQAVLFDFGGVLADEGFYHGLHQVAREGGLDGETFFSAVSREIYTCGYLEGRVDESVFWARIETVIGLPLPAETVRRIILDGFVLRPWMLDFVRALRQSGVRVAMLSDQTNWLDELDSRHGFYAEFEQVFNSYRLGISKYRPETFLRVLGELGLQPGQALFVDDNAGHIQRAKEVGLKTILFADQEAFISGLRTFCPGLALGNSPKAVSPEEGHPR